MLAPGEFTVGSLADATPLSLLLPRTKHETAMLVCGSPAEPMTVFLGEQYRFESFACANATNWKGVIVPEISIEVDESAIFDPDMNDYRTGSVIRRAEQLNIVVIGEDGHRIKRQIQIPLMMGLPPTGENQRAGFSKWQIVVGTGQQKRVLWKTDTVPSAD